MIQTIILTLKGLDSSTISFKTYIRGNIVLPIGTTLPTYFSNFNLKIPKVVRHQFKPESDTLITFVEQQADIVITKAKFDEWSENFAWMLDNGWDLHDKVLK